MAEYEVWNNTKTGKLAGPPHKAHSDTIKFYSRQDAEEWKIKHCDERQDLHNFASDNRMTYEIRENHDK